MTITVIVGRFKGATYTVRGEGKNLNGSPVWYVENPGMVWYVLKSYAKVNA